MVGTLHSVVAHTDSAADSAHQGRSSLGFYSKHHCECSHTEFGTQSPPLLKNPGLQKQPSLHFTARGRGFSTQSDV